MSLPKISPVTAPYYAGGAVLLVVGLWFWKRGLGGVAQDTAQAAVNVASGAVAGVTIGLGQTVGIPATNQTQCQQDLAAGNTLASSFSCDAGTWIGSLFTGGYPPAP